MIETTIYKCEYCGAEFDDEYEANCHEFQCRYNNVKKQDNSALGFYREDGAELIYINRFDVDYMAAFTVGNDSDVKFIKDLFGYQGYENPFHAIEDEENPNYYGLWWFDPDLRCGEWVRVDDQIKKWTYIKNKFGKDA